MTAPAIVVESGDATELNAFLLEQLRAFNVAATGGAPVPLHARVLDASGAIIAAISAQAWDGCCHISMLWVREDRRKQGLGKALMRAIEAEAVRRGCFQATLSTHSFQAPAFYERLGYEPIGTVADCPRGHTKIHYVKRLTP